MPSEGDWIIQIEKDKGELNLQLSEEEIRAMSNYKFQKLIRDKIENIR